MKWDIADDVVAYTPPPAERKAKRLRRAAQVAAVAALTTAVTVGGMTFASQPSTIHVVSYGASEAVPVAESTPFVRPRGTRAAQTDHLVDVSVGMSTRRLADLHRTVFVADSEPEAELIGDYSYL